MPRQALTDHPPGRPAAEPAAGTEPEGSLPSLWPGGPRLSLAFAWSSLATMATLPADSFDALSDESVGVLAAVADLALALAEEIRAQDRVRAYAAAGRVAEPDEQIGDGTDGLIGCHLARVRSVVAAVAAPGARSDEDMTAEPAPTGPLVTTRL